MKVLYIASGTGMAGGATKSLIAMISQMLKREIEIEVVCPDDQGLTQWLRQNEIKAHVVRYRAVYHPSSQTILDILKWVPRFLYYSWINYRGCIKVKRITKDSAPDIIHENTSTINVGYNAAKSIGIPYVMHIREFGPLELNMTVPGRKRRLKGHKVFSIPITKALSRYLQQDSNPKACQIYDGIVQASDFRLNEDKKKWFLYAGRIERAKGISDLLEAYIEYVHASKSPFPLYVCGGCSDPTYLKKIKDFVVKNGIDDKVVWLGERTDIADFMAQTVATIMPSRCEGLGRVMPEAMANGSLCVVRNNTGTKEQLENGVQFTGAPIAISYEEKSQLKDVLMKITESVERGMAFSPGSDFRQMIERSQSAVKEFFTEHRFGEKVYDFYIKVLRESGND